MYLLSVVNEADKEYIEQVFCDSYKEAEDELEIILNELRKSKYPINEVKWSIKEKKQFIENYYKVS